MSDQHALWPYGPNHPKSIRNNEFWQKQSQLPPEARIMQGPGFTHDYNPKKERTRMAGEIFNGTGFIPSYESIRQLPNESGSFHNDLVPLPGKFGPVKDWRDNLITLPGKLPVPGKDWKDNVRTLPGRLPKPGEDWRDNLRPLGV